MEDPDNQLCPVACADLFSVARKCGDIVVEGHPDDLDLWVPIQEADKKLSEARRLCRELWDLAAAAVCIKDIDTSKLLDSMPEWIHSENVQGHASARGGPNPT